MGFVSRSERKWRIECLRKEEIRQYKYSKNGNKNTASIDEDQLPNVVMEYQLKEDEKDDDDNQGKNTRNTRKI